MKRMSASNKLGRLPPPLWAGVSQLEIPESRPRLGPAGRDFGGYDLGLSASNQGVGFGTEQNRTANGLVELSKHLHPESRRHQGFFSNAIPLPQGGRGAHQTPWPLASDASR